MKRMQPTPAMRAAHQRALRNKPKKPQPMTAENRIARAARHKWEDMRMARELGLEDL